MRMVATIEARMNSSRLPGKVLLPANGKPMLYYLIKRLQAVESLDDIVLATTVNLSDDPIVHFAEAHNILVYRGSEDDVMARVIGAAELAKADVVVEITGDCPIIDPNIVEQTIRMFKAHNVSYASNVQIRCYPDGMDTQVFPLSELKRSAGMTNNLLDREHVSLHMRNNPDIFSQVHLVAPPSLEWPELGLTLDERADYELLVRLIEHFDAQGNILFSCHDIVSLLKQRPEWVAINAAVHRKGNT